MHAWVYDLETLALRVYDADLYSWVDSRSVVAPLSG